MRSSDMGRMDADALDAYTTKLDKCTYNEAERKTLTDAYVSKKGMYV